MNGRYAQMQDSLRQGNRKRHEILELKREVERGERTLSSILRDPPWCIFFQRIGEVMLWEKGWGDVRVTAVLKEASVLWQRRIEDVTMRQRNVLADLIEQKNANKVRYAKNR